MPRPIFVQCCIEGPEYESGPMPTVEVREAPTVVLEDLQRRIETELADRKRILMIVRQGGLR